jgi:hypothetical protein
MKKAYVIVALSLLMTLNSAEKEAENQTASNENEATQSEESSTLDRVIETIADAAINDRDFGKDIGDR